ncbi:reverse transcriptase domain-containing protein [Tanacetum coccineum]
MTTAPTDRKVSSGSLPLCERCFTRHVGHCTIKCHKCGNVGHKARYCKEKNVAMGANALPILSCYDCGEKVHTRNRCPRKVKQEEVGEVRSRKIIMLNVIPPDHVDDVPVVEPNQHDDVPIVPEPVLEDEDEDPEEEEFKEE